MDTVNDPSPSARMPRNLAGTPMRDWPKDVTERVWALQPNAAIVRTRTAQDGRAEVSRG